jgi:hypothetical protein
LKEVDNEAVVQAWGYRDDAVNQIYQLHKFWNIMRRTLKRSLVTLT